MSFKTYRPVDSLMSGPPGKPKFKNTLLLKSANHDLRLQHVILVTSKFTDQRSPKKYSYSEKV